jgi:AcrR family transcriptional regulator
MPKVMRAPEDIEVVKKRILDTAADIICEQGFDSLSMRKLASKLGMTAANIYNYYSNQDELYLSIQIRGFSRFYEQFFKAYARHENPIAKLKELINTYLDFGITNPGYYEIMMDSNTPRYTEYVGTKMEPLAYKDKLLSLKLVEIATTVFEEIAELDNHFLKKDSPYRALQLWSSIHGIVTLRNRKIWREVVDDPDLIIKRMADDLLLQFSGKTSV